MSRSAVDAELLDVVDDEDRVVGQASRGEIHRCGLKHRAVHMLVRNSRGEVLLQRRALDKDNSPGLWDTSAAGHVDAGETYIDAAYRELQEELGLCVSGQLEEVLSLAADASNGQEFVRVYRLQTDQSIAADPVEIIETRWLSAADLRRWLQVDPDEFTSTFRAIWRHLGQLSD